MHRSQGGGYSRCAANLAVFVWLVVGLGPRLARAIELPPGFVAETIATNLNAATAIAPSPDGRIFIADQTGRLLVWKDGRVLDTPALALHVTDYWERGLIGLTLDPDFPRAPLLYVLYVTDRPFVHHVLSKFTLDGDRINPASETILLEGDDQATLGGGVPAGHQGGALRFGPAGRLYVSIGEQTAGEPSQRLGTLQGKILRLNRDGSIPADNPFFNETTGKYRTIYARGVRNSFGIAAQPKADDSRMFFTDVGGSAFEEVNELKPGANYGWPRAEGFSTNTAFLNPIHAYPPMVGQSIVGGAFVPGSAVNGQSPSWPEKWRGRFLFGDFMKHWIKALDPDAPTNVLTFARGLNGPVATELAPDGSLLVLNRSAVWRDPKKFVPNAGSLVRIRYVGGTVARHSTSPATNEQAAAGLPMQFDAMPKRLTREVLESWSRARPGERGGYWLPALEWHYEVEEEPVFRLPVGRKLRLDADGRLRFPAGTVFFRNFLVLQDPALRPPMQTIETRVVVLTADSAAFGCSYRWTTFAEAELVEDGEQASRPTTTEARATHEIRWWYPAQEPFLSLPITSPAFLIPQHAAELNFRNSSNNATLFNYLIQEGLFDPTPDAASIRAIPEIVRWTDTSAPIEARVRSYLHGNCAVCHQPGGTSRGNLDLRLTTPLARTGLIDGEPVAGDLGIAGAKVVLPGSPEKSLIYQRVKRTDFFRMPPGAYHNEPSPILPAMEEWIRSLDQTTKGNQPPR